MLKSKALPPAGSVMEVEIPKLGIQTMNLRLVGDSELICHKWSQKAITDIQSKQSGAARAKKGARDPMQEYLDSMYEHPDGGYGFPTLAFKSAAVDAWCHVEGIRKGIAQGAFHVIGELVQIQGEPRMRTDMRRIGIGIGDPVYRGAFKEWAVDLTIRFNPNVLSAAQIVNLFNTAGFAMGVGDWRPQKGGNFGMFHCE